jgi:hypothetical protein
LAAATLRMAATTVHPRRAYSKTAASPKPELVPAIKMVLLTD